MHPPEKLAGSDATPPPDPLIGRTIAGKFRVEAFVGRGAMGAVYKATQLVLKKKIAIKVMNPDKPADGAYAGRFKREAKAASRLDHPNSMRVIDFGEDDGLLYIAMEFLEGKDLLQILRDEFPLTKDRIVAILSQALAALAVAHEMGVIHRDLKPENIMLLPSKDDEGRPTEVVKVCDFGIAKILEPTLEGDGEGGMPQTSTHTGTLTAHGMLIGTPEYMSPEQARGEPADARSDLYSLGVILFQLLTGRLPFIANSKIRLVIKHVEEKPPQPSEIDSQVDLRLEAICMKCLEKRPEDRFQTAREMRVEVRAVLEAAGESIRMPVRSSPPRQDSSSGGRPAVAPLAGAGVTRPSDPPKRARESDPPQGAKPPSDRPKPRAEPTATAETMDPQEASAAIAEARKMLSGRPPPPSLSQPTSQPAPSPGTDTTGPSLAAVRRSPTGNTTWAIVALLAIAAVAIVYFVFIKK